MQYDVAVVGSGIGGMCAAAKLAHAGKRVVVVERFPILGGRYTSVEYEGQIVHHGSVVLIWGEGSPVWRTLQEVEAPKFETKTFSQARFCIGGKKLDVEFDKLSDIKPLLDMASADEEEKKRVLAAMRAAALWREPSDTITFKAWLQQYTANENIFGLFNCLATSTTGLNIHEVPAGEYIRVLKCSAAFGKPTLVVKNGLIEVLNSLEHVIKQHKGEVLTECEVTNISVRNGTATGIVARRHGQTVKLEAKVVVSNVGPVRTIELAGREHFEKSYLEEVREKIRPCCGIVFEVASVQPLIDFTGFLFAVGPGMRMSNWCSFGDLWENWTPKGKHLLEAWLVPLDNLSYDPRSEHEHFLKEAKAVFPHWEKSEPEVVRLKHFCGNWPASRAWGGYRLDQRTSVENLYCVGDANGPSGFVGGEAAAESGRLAAAQIEATLQ